MRGLSIGDLKKQTSFPTGFPIRKAPLSLSEMTKNHNKKLSPQNIIYKKLLKFFQPPYKLIKLKIVDDVIIDIYLNKSLINS